MLTSKSIILKKTMKNILGASIALRSSVGKLEKLIAILFFSGILFLCKTSIFFLVNKIVLM